MAKPHEKLAESLAILKKLQEGGRRIFKSDELSRVHRERLLQNGFLRDVIRGWVMSTGPQAQQQDTTPWYASFWEFCSLYCNERFGKDWFLSPEQSLLLHAEAPTIPPQVVVNTPKGKNNKIDLLFGTSIYDLQVKEMPVQLTEKNGQRAFTVEAALIRVPEGFFQRAPIEMQVAMASVRDVSTVLALLLDGGHSAVAGRLAGAFRRVGRDAFADEIVAAFKAAGYDVRESDPFAGQAGVTAIPAGVPPLVARLRAIWESQREAVIEVFPKASGLPADKDAYMKFVEDIYESDAYHSLSIEGYSVTPELIDRVREGSWNPEIDEEDRKNRDALAARGYYLAFQKVKEFGRRYHKRQAGRSVDARYTPRMVPGTVRAVRDRWYTHGECACRISQPTCVPARLATCTAANRGGGRWDDRAIRFTGGGERSVGARRARALARGLCASLSGRQWPDGAVSHECHAGLRRLSLDSCQGGRPQGLSGRAGGGERPYECEAVCRVPGGAGEVVV